MLNAKDFNRKKFDDNWLGIVLPQSSQERQMKGFGGFAIRRKVAIMGHTPSNRGEIDDKDVVFAIVAVDGTAGGGGGNIKRTPRIFQGDVVYGTFLDKDTKQQPIILGVLGRTGNIKYEKGIYGRYDITTGFVGSLQPLKLLGRGQTNEDKRDCTPLSIPFEDAMRAAAGMLSEKGGVPTKPTVGAIPPPPKLEETEVDPNIDEKITNAENKVNNLEDKKNAFDAQESASEGSTDREEYKENEQKLDDAKNEVNRLKNDKNKAVNNANTFRARLRAAAAKRKEEGSSVGGTGPDIELYPIDVVNDYIENSNRRKNEYLLKARYGGTGRYIQIGDKIYQPWDPNYLNAFNQGAQIPRQ